MPGRRPAFSALITAEHASNDLPEPWRPLFAGAEGVLAGHRGWDPGSLALARSLSSHLDAPLLAGKASRLLIDLNRSRGHPARYSTWTRGLPEAQRAEIERRAWLPHWRAFRQVIEDADRPVIHIACHSFAPVLDGRVRDADIGLLYDPSRIREKMFCRQLSAAIKTRMPAVKARMNYPYRGTANGIGQYHRRLFGEDRLITIELEVNQRLVGTSEWSHRIEALSKCVVSVFRSIGNWG